MGTLIDPGIISLDGYINDTQGHFDLAVPSDEVHAFVNGLELLDECRRAVGIRGEGGFAAHPE